MSDENHVFCKTHLNLFYYEIPKLVPTKIDLLCLYRYGKKCDRNQIGLLICTTKCDNT